MSVTVVPQELSPSVPVSSSIRPLPGALQLQKKLKAVQNYHAHFFPLKNCFSLIAKAYFAQQIFFLEFFLLTSSHLWIFNYLFEKSEGNAEFFKSPPWRLL